jgi:hypothetical protein
MSEHELGKMLLQAETSGPSESRDGARLTAQLLDRDRRQVRRLGTITLLLWLLGAAGIGFVLYELSVYVPEYMDFRWEKSGTRSTERRLGFQESYFAGFQIGMIVVAGSVAVFALAGLGTFLLVHASRRATLRQINASLVLISKRLEQLHELRESERTGPAISGDSCANPRREA